MTVVLLAGRCRAQMHPKMTDSIYHHMPHTQHLKAPSGWPCSVMYPLHSSGVTRPRTPVAPCQPSTQTHERKPISTSNTESTSKETREEEGSRERGNTADRGSRKDQIKKQCTMRPISACPDVATLLLPSLRRMDRVSASRCTPVVYMLPRLHVIT